MAMKTYQIEAQRLIALRQRKGLFELRLDALVLPAPKGQDSEGGSPSSVLSLSEADARSLLLLLKNEFASMEKKNLGRSQR
jgi:hypothetical protein